MTLGKQLVLFENNAPDVSTEGVKYAGSKLKLIPDILSIVEPYRISTVWDAFSGTTRVSQAFAKNGYRVISSDRAIWSEVFATCYLCCSHSRRYYEELFEHLNGLKPVCGWFTENYGSVKSASEGGERRPWQAKNTMKLDAIRTEIDRLDLSKIDKSVALTGLMLALDKVDNTLGHYASYLKEWSPRSYNDLWLEIPHFPQYEQGLHTVYCDDVFNLTERSNADLAYFDPPYGSNNEKMPPSRVRYSSYYHIWKTVCLNDKPDLFGRANRRCDSKDTVSPSLFEEYRKDSNGKYIAVEAIERLVRETKSTWILLSYSSGGRATAQELQDVLSSNGEIVAVRAINYKKNVMAEMRSTNEWLREAEEPNKEFLFLLHKG